MTQQKKFQKRNRLLQQRIIGILISLISIGLLALAGFYLYGKYTAPNMLARLLPVDGTLLFLELKTEVADPDYQQFTNIYSKSGLTILDLLDIQALGLTKLNTFADLLGRRVGVAFFGSEFDPQQFALITEVKDLGLTKDYLISQAISGENLSESTYLGYEVLTYPRSRALAAAFVGQDLILAANETLLHRILEAAAGSRDNIAESAAFGAVRARINPRAIGFSYLSPSALHQLILRQLSGLDFALASSLLDLWQGGGVEIRPGHNALRVRVFFALKDEYARDSLFFRQKSLDLGLVNLLGKEVSRFYIGTDLADQLETFLASVREHNSSLALLLSGYLERSSQEWLGKDQKLAGLAKFLTKKVVIGQTRTGGFFAAISSDQSETFKKLLIKSEGTLTAGLERFRLPDDTDGRRLIVGRVRTYEIQHDDVMITHLRAVGNPWEFYLADRDGVLLITTEEEQIKKMLDRQKKNVSGGFKELVSASNLVTDDIYFTHLDSKIPQLSPFKFLFAGKDTDPAGLEIKLLFGK